MIKYIDTDFGGNKMKRSLALTLIIIILVLAFFTSCSGRTEDKINSDTNEGECVGSSSAIDNEISTTSAEGIPDDVSRPVPECKAATRIDGYLKTDIDRSLKCNNVFLGKTYVPSRSPVDSKPDIYNEKLTDGWTLSICTPRNVVGYPGSSPLYIDFDMGNEECDIAEIAVYCHRTVQYGYGLPSYVSVKVSDDGSDYTEIGKVFTPSDLDACCRYCYRLPFAKAFSARYVRILFGQNEGDMLCVDEICAFSYCEDGVLVNMPGIEEDQVYCVKDFYDFSLNLGESSVKVSKDDPDYDKVQNLAQLDGVDFQIQHFDPLNNAHENSGRDKLYLLTDGVLHGEEERDYFKFHRGGGRNVICDLGAVMSVQSCNLAFLDRKSWGITTPAVYYVSLSENGIDWTTVFAEHYPDYGVKMRQRDTRKCDFGGEYLARYVKLSFTTVPDNTVSAFVYLGEWEIIGRKNTENAKKAEYDKNIVYGNYPDRDDWGFHNILFTCVGDVFGKHCIDVHVLTESAAESYMAGTDENGNTVPLMDSFMFTTRGPMNQYPDRSAGFSFFLDELFYKDVNMDAVEKVTPRVNSALGREGKTPVWISVNCPVQGDTFEGKEIKTADDYIECLKWQADEAIRRFDERNYKNIYLVGFYWQHENIRKDGHDAEAAIAFNEYVHSLGYKCIWCPYYTANGLFNAHYYGFDLTCLQPNYMFSYSLPGRIDAAAEIAKIYGLGIEIEIENLYQSRDALDYYRKYLRGGYDHGYIDSVNVYYQGSIPGAYTNCPKRKDDISMAIYYETLQYANGDIDRDYDVPERADLSRFGDVSAEVGMNKQTTIQLGELYGVKYRLYSLPAYGAVRLDESGRVYYKPLRNYTGEDTISVLLYDNVGEYKIVTVDLTIK